MKERHGHGFRERHGTYEKATGGPATAPFDSK